METTHRNDKLNIQRPTKDSGILLSLFSERRKNGTFCLHASHSNSKICRNVEQKNCYNLLSSMETAVCCVKLAKTYTSMIMIASEQLAAIKLKSIRKFGGKFECEQRSSYINTKPFWLQFKSVCVFGIFPLRRLNLTMICLCLVPFRCSKNHFRTIPSFRINKMLSIFDLHSFAAIRRLLRSALFHPGCHKNTPIATRLLFYSWITLPLPTKNKCERISLFAEWIYLNA